MVSWVLCVWSFGFGADVKVYELDDFFASAGDVEGKGSWGLLEWTGGTDLGYRAFILSNYDQRQELYPTASLSFTRSVVHLICGAMHSVPAVSDCQVVHTAAGAL